MRVERARFLTLLQCARAGMGMLCDEVGMLSRGRLHGGRPHARWQRRARGMGSEPTKISCTSCHPSYDGHR